MDILSFGIPAGQVRSSIGRWFKSGSKVLRVFLILSVFFNFLLLRNCTKHSGKEFGTLYFLFHVYQIIIMYNITLIYELYTRIYYPWKPGLFDRIEQTRVWFDTLKYKAQFFFKTSSSFIPNTHFPLPGII